MMCTNAYANIQFRGGELIEKKINNTNLKQILDFICSISNPPPCMHYASTNENVDILHSSVDKLAIIIRKTFA
jgi:hypothetical protein